MAATLYIDKKPEAESLKYKHVAVWPIKRSYSSFFVFFKK